MSSQERNQFRLFSWLLIAAAILYVAPVIPTAIDFIATRVYQEVDRQ